MSFIFTAVQIELNAKTASDNSFPVILLFLFFTTKNPYGSKGSTGSQDRWKFRRSCLENIPFAGNFIQSSPTPNSPASFKTEVKILYDNDAIYVGAYMYDDPSQIRKQITARDEEQRADVDYFSVFFDTYNDKQNGFQFLVTTMNVQTDARLGPNLGGNFLYGDFGDKTLDAVWDSRVSIKKDGWVVEIMIPYSALRFSKRMCRTGDCNYSGLQDVTMNLLTGIPWIRK